MEASTAKRNSDVLRCRLAAPASIVRLARASISETVLVGKATATSTLVRLMAIPASVSAALIQHVQRGERDEDYSGHGGADG
jgi:hypothetical protein